MTLIGVITNKRDVTTDFVIAALKRRNVSYFRFNTEDMLRRWETTWTLDGWTIRDDRGRSVRSDDIDAIYYRRPYRATPIDGTADISVPFIQREASAYLNGLQSTLDCRWISRPEAIEAAEDKLRQLRLARSLGFRVPRSIVTNNIAEARAFLHSVDSAIVKPLSSGDLGFEPAKIVYTSLVDDHDDLDAVALAPHFFQERIVKTFDVRVTVVDDSLFACRIDSQSSSETSLDWRVAASRSLNLPHQLVELPNTTKLRCIDLVRALGLRFGAIDLIETVDDHVFLEINPNGQWAWIEHRTKAPISDAIVDALLLVTIN